MTKFSRILSEVMTGISDTGKFQRYLDSGWKIVHNKGTAFVGLEHPSGGKLSLLEVRTYGTDFTLGEADEVARIVAELMQVLNANQDKPDSYKGPPPGVTKPSKLPPPPPRKPFEQWRSEIREAGGKDWDGKDVEQTLKEIRGEL